MAQLKKKRMWVLPQKWRIFLRIMSVCVLLSLIVWFWVPSYQMLILYFLYTIPTNSFIPIPHEPVILYFSHFYGPLIIAIVGTCATMIAAFIDYQVVSAAFSHRRIAPVKNTRIYTKSVSYFYKFPFFTVLCFAFFPLPFYPIRVLAISSKYSIWRYFAAVVLGRFPRYYILALFGYYIKVPISILALVFIIFLFITCWPMIQARLFDNEQSKEDEIEEVEDDFVQIPPKVVDA
jgi:membrane protein YqaA with SNARE-associated domain